MLAHSPDIAYLREPVTQPYQALFSKSDPQNTVFDPTIDAANARHYQRFADAAFAGLPARELLDAMVRVTAFATPGRHRRRLLIKEVNPLAVYWYVQR